MATLTTINQEGAFDSTVRGQVNSNFAALNAVSLAEATPSAANATGVKGSIRFDANYIYVCTAANTWKRAAITTW